MADEIGNILFPIFYDKIVMYRKLGQIEAFLAAFRVYLSLIIKSGEDRRAYRVPERMGFLPEKFTSAENI